MTRLEVKEAGKKIKSPGSHPGLDFASWYAGYQASLERKLKI